MQDHEPEPRCRARWAASGAMALTGDADGPPLVAPDAVVARVAALGDRLGVDALAVLGERAALSGLSRRGTVSCGGATRLVPAADGWVAVSLARPDDVDLLPAWFERDVPPGDDSWPVVEAEMASRPASEAVARARLLGLPVAALDEAASTPRAPVVTRRLDAGGGPAGGRGPDGALVVDLSSLWAGPLCAELLGAAGAAVVKVESTTRPDGARRGPSDFYDLLHAGHRAVALDFSTDEGRARLRRLLEAADVVVEASRPRALAQLGIDAAGGGPRPRVWVSITGHGRQGPGAGAIAFGDDAAVAGGLVAWGADGRPRFVADAASDPLSGMAAAAAVRDALRTGGRWLLDVSMAHVAADVAGALPAPGAAPGPWSEGLPGEAAPPSARRPAGRAAPLGADTAAVLDELGIP